MEIYCPFWKNSWLLQTGTNLCVNVENLWVLTGNPIVIVASKQEHKNASEYHLNQSHMDK